MLPDHKTQYNLLAGLVTISDIKQVRITYEDGKQATVPVRNGAWGEVRTWADVNASKTGIRKVEGLNAAGEVVVVHP